MLTVFGCPIVVNESLTCTRSDWWRRARFRRSKPRSQFQEQPWDDQAAHRSDPDPREISALSARLRRRHHSVVAAPDNNSTFGQIFNGMDKLVDASVRLFSELFNVKHQIRYLPCLFTDHVPCACHDRSSGCSYRVEQCVPELQKAGHDEPRPARHG
jgi:hypothetical protein